MRPHALWGAFLAVLVLTGCASMARPSNTLEALKVSAEYATALTLSVNQARSTGLLSAEDHDKALDVMQNTKDSLQLALNAYNIGNFGEAADRLGQIELGLRAVALILARANP